jgi:hypothetical protein
METEHLSLSPMDFIESTDFVDELDLSEDYFDNSNCDEIVFGLNW